MASEYVNRKGDKYFLYEGKTKTGKAKYYCSRKPSASGVPVDVMPDGYEWRENPEDAVVSVRRIRDTAITREEYELVQEGVRVHAGLEAFIVDVDGDSLIVYLSDRDPRAVASVFESIFGIPGGQALSMGDFAGAHARYSPMMKFELSNDDRREFRVARMYFRGGSERWRSLGSQAPLPDLLRHYARHLGKESFYELG